MSKKDRLKAQAAKKAAKEQKQQAEKRPPAPPLPETVFTDEVIDLLSQLAPEHQQILEVSFARKQRLINCGDCPVIECKECCKLIEDMMPAKAREAAAASGIKDGVFTPSGEYIAVDNMTPAAAERWKRSWRNHIFDTEQAKRLWDESTASSAKYAKGAWAKPASSAAKDKQPKREYTQPSAIMGISMATCIQEQLGAQVAAKVDGPSVEPATEPAKQTEIASEKTGEAPQVESPTTSSMHSPDSLEEEFAGVEAARTRLEDTMKDMRIFLAKEKIVREGRGLLEDLTTDEPGATAHYKSSSRAVAKNLPKMHVKKKKEGTCRLTVRFVDILRIEELIAHALCFIECDMKLGANSKLASTAVVDVENRTNFMAVVYDICRHLNSDIGFVAEKLGSGVHTDLIQRSEGVLAYIMTQDRQYWEDELKLRLSEKGRALMESGAV